MIIFKRKHLSIKWGIFAGILVFLAILLLLLFLLQTVYLDDIYKAAKKNTLNNANDKVEQILDDQLGNLSVMEQQLDELTAEYDIDIQISGEVYFFTARFACMRIHFQSNFIRTFTNGQRKMEAVLLRSSQVISSVIPLNCLPKMENCPRSQPVTETRRVNLLKMRILEMESV